MKLSDSGFTYVNNTLLPKNSPIIEFFGELDELTVVLGLARKLCEEYNLNDVASKLRAIQLKLLSIARCIARDCKAVMNEDVVRLEQEIKTLKKEIGEVKLSIPYGPIPYMYIHMARTVCRRLERIAAALLFSKALDETTYTYLNRLSKYLFYLAKYVAKRLNHAEEPLEETMYATDQS